MSYEVLTEWSGNVMSWLYRYSIPQAEVAERAGMSYVYLCRLLHMQKPFIGSCMKVDKSISKCLETRGFSSRQFRRQQTRLRNKLRKVVSSSESLV